MYKFAIVSILLTISLISCNKEPLPTESDLSQSIEGWEISKSDYNFDINPRDIFFVNPATGFVVGYRGDIFKTIDSGITWEKLNPGTSLHLHSVFFLNENVGFVSSEAMSGCLDADCNKGSLLLKTVDGGATWTKTFFPGYTRILSLKFFDSLNGVAIIHTPDIPNSKDEYVATTSDGGINWNLLDLPIRPYADKIFIVDNTLFIEGTNQKILKSSDHGKIWITINTPVESKYDIRNIYFFNENIGFIDGVTAVFKTTDGGFNWVKTNYPFTNFDTFHFYSENEGFNVETVSSYTGGDFPTFQGSICYETSDGGITWSKSDLVKTLYLGLTYFPQRDLGYGFNLSEFCTIKKK